MHRPSADDRALGCMPLFRFYCQRFQCQGYEPLLDFIVRVRSTACNHGPVSHGCMIMQSTTHHSTLEVIRCRQSSDCVSIDHAPSCGSLFDSSPGTIPDKRNDGIHRADEVELSSEHGRPSASVQCFVRPYGP